jgi:hypothetical protein
VHGLGYAPPTPQGLGCGESSDAREAIGGLPDAFLGSPAQRLIGACLLRVANKRAVVLERYNGEVGRVWKAQGSDARRPAVLEAAWRLGQHGPVEEVLKGSRDLLALEVNTKAALDRARGTGGEGGRRTKHDDMTCAVVLLPAWMLQENEAGAGAWAALALGGRARAAAPWA